MSPHPTGTILFDLSPQIGPEIPVWPGDTPFASHRLAEISAESAVVLSSITTTVHLGSHADAPLHTEPGGIGIESMPLDAYVGPCRVVEVGATELVTRSHLPDVALADPPRLLLKTRLEAERRKEDRARFPEDFPAIAPELARELAASGLLLVGTDRPSVDPFTSRALEAHHALLGAGVAVLEGLVLDPVPPGLYELIALPLSLRGLDASPVRAVLRAWPA